MKAIDVLVGRVYHDGKQGLRRVTEEGAHCNRYDAPPGTDCVAYEVLAARSLRPHDHQASTRENFGAWAKGRVPVDQEATAVEILQAQALVKGLRPIQKDLLLRLEQAQAGRPHAQPLVPKEVRAALDLKSKAVLLMPAPTYARLSPLGERLVRLIQGETFTVPVEDHAPVTRPRRRPSP